MIEVLSIAGVALAVLAVLMVIVLVARRVALARGERRRARLEHDLRSVALDVIDGEVDPTAAFTRAESRALAVLVARYSRSLAGDARSNVAGFFEGRGDVRREIRLLTARRTWRRAAAAFALGDMAAPSSIPALKAALDDRSRDVRSAAARSLGRLGAVDAVPRLVDGFVSRAVPRGVGGFALLNIGGAARAELRGLASHDEAAVRSATAELIGFVGTPADALLLIGMLRDLAAEVRGAAAVALGRVGAESAVVALRAALEDRVPQVRTAVAQSLGALDDIDATKALVRQAEHDLFEPAEAAARSLALIDPVEAIEQGQVEGANPHLLHAASLAELGR
jgi:HEAT repeat protein